jgi:cysteine sulfinate desulfinase/cysteine desulfurase-like protein
MHDEPRAHSNIHITVGRANDADQIDEAARQIADTAESLRAFAL